MRDAHYPLQTGPAPVREHSIFRRLAWAGLLLLAGCASTGGTAPGPGSEAFGLGDEGYREPTALAAVSNDVLMRAIGLVGTPYRYGGTSPEGGFDCSGLVGFVFHEAAGLNLPRSTRELIEIEAPGIDRDDLQPGDLVYFNPRGGRVSHIGIYVGEDRFVHAPSAGGTVRLDSLQSEYWRRYYVGAKRILR